MPRFWSIADFKSWPPGISDGLASNCAICGARPSFDYQVDDETWNNVVTARLRASVVCLPCLDNRARTLGIDVCQHLREIQFAGSYGTAVLVPALVVSRDEAKVLP